MDALGLDQTVVAAFLQVVLIDLVMSGDNAIIIGMAVAGLPAENRRGIIFWGVTGATVLRLVFAGITTQLLQVIGLTLAGGLLLMWVAWRMYRELRLKARHGSSEVEEAAHAPPKTMRQAMIQIIAADVSMSLDNVLAVAGAARDHLAVLWFGLLLSVILMAVASSFIARLLDRHHWLAWIGFLIIVYVAGDMIWDGTHEVVAATGTG
ncbi:MAG: TerC family protein [Proteobacteria bacterium]|nr:TerC family protein [Pseudomonadota bacterium]